MRPAFLLLALSALALAHARSIVFDRKETSLLASALLSSQDDLDLEDVRRRCPCADAALCLPVRLANPQALVNRTHEVYAFSPTATDRWKHYDYDLVTTVAWNTNKELLCHAHHRGVQIAVLHNFETPSQLCSKPARRAWVEATYKMMLEHFADGVNIDNEQPMQGELAACQTLLVKELRAELQRHRLTRDAQITFDVSWAPRGVDGRYYQWKELSLAVDFLFVMSYDMRSQLYSHCLAGANSPLAQVRQGLDEFLVAYEIDPRKLVLGLPWYGYLYPCTAPVDAATQLCAIKAVPFVGAPCSDAAGRQVDYGDIQRMRLAKEKEQENTGTDRVTRHWDAISQSPFLVFRNGGANSTATAKGKEKEEEEEKEGEEEEEDVEVWYDDERSLTLKYGLAKELGLLGVGMWNADALDYEHAADESAAIWRTLRAGW